MSNSIAWNRGTLFAAIWILLSWVRPPLALGQETGANRGAPIDEIVVTAEKWERSANSVGMALTATSAAELKDRGIDSVADLVRLVPGLTIQQSSFNSTSFALRGVGFFNSDLATPPAVTVYVDEAPLPYPAMTKLAAFDLARVEVLNGPQGTVFGQNATGGAVNYIAAKPSQTLETGLDATYGRFNRLQLGAFASGSISDGLSGRIAIQGQRGDPWQESITRPRDQLGRIREVQGRGTLEWLPSAGLTSRLTFTATYDGSDSPTAQLIVPRATFPPLAAVGLLTSPVVTSPRAADWVTLRPDTNTAFPYTSNTTLYEVTWRNDFRLNGDLTVTALSSYAYFKLAYGQDPSGTPFQIDNVIDRDGRVSDFFQELRIAGRRGLVHWLVGANYVHDNVEDDPLEFSGDDDAGHVFRSIDPQAFPDELRLPARTHVETYAGFGQLELNATNALAFEGGVRYNVDRRSFDNCSIAVTQRFADFWNIFRGGAAPATRPGDCYVVDAEFQPVDNVHHSLNEDSLSWRAGAKWTAATDLLLYINVSKGFKAGAVPALAATTTAQFTPLRQESLLAYEGDSRPVSSTAIPNSTCPGSITTTMTSSFEGRCSIRSLAPWRRWFPFRSRMLTELKLNCSSDPP